MASRLHILLTRFNVATPGREAPIRNTPGWLERRFDIFERYCLPSISAQSRSDFSWLIYFDSQTPTLFKERIERDRKVFNFTPKFVDLFEIEEIVKELASSLPETPEMLLTTRLDNDDAVSLDFIERIHSAAETAKDGTVLNFTNGLALRNEALYSARDLSNPFTTLVERVPTSPKTIWSAQHHELGNKWTLAQVDAPPVWLQVIHGENVTNRVKGKRLSRKILANRFAISDGVSIRRDQPIRMAFDNLVLHPLRMAREKIWRMAKPFIKGLIGRA